MSARTDYPALAIYATLADYGEATRQATAALDRIDALTHANDVLRAQLRGVRPAAPAAAS